MSRRLEVVPVHGLPEIATGDPLGELIADGLAERGRASRRPATSSPSPRRPSRRRRAGCASWTTWRRAARRDGWPTRLGKDPRLVELILSESRAVVRAERDLLIVETLSGWICANAGIDASNVPGADRVTLLPEDPDASARRIRAEIGAAAGVRPAVVVSDSFGRPWRLGQADVAIGCAGLAPLDDWRGRTDHEGRELAATVVAVADEVAAAADLARGKDAGVPACLVRGLERFVSAEDGPGARAIQRPEAEDLFR